MKRIVLLTIISICLILTAMLVSLWGRKSYLVSPISEKENIEVISTPAPTSTVPQTFKFDANTNLKEELEKINPQVLDSDFESNNE